MSDQWKTHALEIYNSKPDKYFACLKTKLKTGSKSHASGPFCGVCVVNGKWAKSSSGFRCSQKVWNFLIFGMVPQDTLSIDFIRNALIRSYSIFFSNFKKKRKKLGLALENLWNKFNNAWPLKKLHRFNINIYWV